MSNSADKRIGINRGFLLGQSGQAVADAMNKNFRLISVLLQASVKSATTPFEAVPTTTVDGDAFIVPASGTGEWATHGGEIAQYDTSLGQWFFVKVNKGLSIYIEDEDKQKVFTSSG